jgi:hypothetical protein
MLTLSFAPENGSTHGVVARCDTKVEDVSEVELGQFETEKGR